ncbi:transposase [Bacillus sp. FSL R12-0069]|uniref:transposase n=1 Tax=Bacillus sp. FSL R12-0069 TaxID=2975342 RepID=UPI0030FB9F9E
MILFYEDETHIRDYQALHTSWFLRGKQKQIPTYGRHASVTLFGAVNTQNGRLHCMEASSCNAIYFRHGSVAKFTNELYSFLDITERLF